MGLLHDCETSNFAKVSLQLYMIYCDNTPGMLTWLQHLSIMSPPSLGTRLLPQGCSELQWIAVKPTWRVHIVVMGQRGTPSFPPSFSYNEWKICMCMNIIYCIIYIQNVSFSFGSIWDDKNHRISKSRIGLHFFQDWQIYAFRFDNMPKSDHLPVCGYWLRRPAADQWRGRQWRHGPDLGTSPARDTGQWGREPGSGASHGLQSWTVASVLLTSWQKKTIYAA